MGTKRPASSIHPSRREQVPNAPRKRHKPDNLGKTSFKKARPINDLKTRIRNLTRLLSRDDEDDTADTLPPHVRIEKERELQSTRHELSESRAAERRSKMIARYHMVRFFDRQKATKRLKKARKVLAGLGAEAGGEERAGAARAVREAEVDVEYAVYYPLMRPYSSLFPARKDGDEGDGGGGEKGEDNDGRKGDPYIRELVRECMANGKLDDLRNGKLTNEDGEASNEPEAPAVKVKSKKAGPKSTKKRTNDAAPVDSDAESEGGFFE